MPDQFEVARIISALPVRVSHPMTAAQYQLRVSEILRLLDIDAVPEGTGVRFGGDGVSEDDQPLVFAIRALVARRFGVPDGA